MHSEFSPSTSGLVVVADVKPLSLLATAGVLHHAGMRVLCARTSEAVRKAFEVSPQHRRIDAGDELLRRDAAVERKIDLLVWDVGEEPNNVLAVIETIRATPLWSQLPVILLAETRWAGLERRTESLTVATHCLYKPIDPKSLAAIAQQLMWMPSMQQMHRARGGRPGRPGWVSL